MLIITFNCIEVWNRFCFVMLRKFRDFPKSFWFSNTFGELSSKVFHFLRSLSFKCTVFSFSVKLLVNKSRFLKSFKNLILNVYTLYGFPIEPFLSICFEPFGLARCNIISNRQYLLKQIRKNLIYISNDL